MRGETKHVVSKAMEIIHRLSLRPDFQTDVKNCRKHLGIPDGSFKWQKSHAELEKIKSKNFIERVMWETVLLEKYRVPRTNTFIMIFDCYILNGDVAATPETYPNASFSLEIPNADEVKKHGHSYVKIVIYDTASQDDMINYITEKSKIIKYFLDAQSTQPIKRIRKSKNQKMDQRMAELNAMSKRDLEKQLGFNKFIGYKHSLVWRVLRKEGFNPTSQEAVKKAAQRLRQKSGTHKPRG